MNKKPQISIGGQAVIEGVMMRGPRHIATAVRRADQRIRIKREPFVSITQRIKFFGLPLIRGFVSLIEMMIIGLKSLNFSADEAMKDEPKPDNSEQKKKTSSFDGIIQFGSYVFAIAFAFFLFMYLPYKIAYWVGIGKANFSFNLLVGIIRVVFFVAYLLIISLMKDVRRLFEFHGAEHKSVFAYEANPHFTLADTRHFTTFHPRCGTSFIFLVLLISVIFFSIFDTGLSALLGTMIPLYIRIPAHLLLLPLISGISYEILKYSGKNQHHWLVRFFTAPGLALQHITTKAPDDSQLEVAICALHAALEDPIDNPNIEFVTDHELSKKN